MNSTLLHTSSKKKRRKELIKSQAKQNRELRAQLAHERHLSRELQARLAYEQKINGDLSRELGPLKRAQQAPTPERKPSRWFTRNKDWGYL